MYNIKRKLTDFMCRVRRGTARFPLSVFFAVLLTVTAIVLTHIDHSRISDSTEFFLYWYPITAILLSTALSLWHEEYRSGKSTTVYIIAEAILPCVIILLSRTAGDVSYAPGLYILLGIVVLLVMAVFALPFLHKSGSPSEVSFWNFTVRSISAAAAALLVGGILFGGLSLLLLSLDKLFGLKFSNDMYGDIAAVCFLFVTPILTLQGIPDGQRKYDSSPMKVPGLISTAFRFLFIPLTLAYIVTLYVYAFRILFTWELPQGWISWPVSFSVFAVTALYTLAYPFLFKTGNATEGQNAAQLNSRLTILITRILPLLMLPLLVLMSVGIARRISQYGISILRIYLIFFNLWSYGACAAIAFSHHKRVMWIPLSAVLLFAGLSIFPINVPTFVRDRMTSQLNGILASSSWDGQPMDEDRYNEWLLSLDSESAALADSRLSYLKREFSHRQTDSIINVEVWPGRVADYHSKESDDSATDNVEMVSLSGYDMMPDTIISIPEGAVAFRMIDYSNDIRIDDIADDTLHFSIPAGSESAESPALFNIPLDAWRELSDMNPYGKRPASPLCYSDVSGKHILIVRSFSLYAGRNGGNCNVIGLLFNMQDETHATPTGTSEN